MFAQPFLLSLALTVTGVSLIVAVGMDGTEKWGIDAPRGRATPVVAADGTIYAVSGIGTFTALDILWKSEVDAGTG